MGETGSLDFTWEAKFADGNILTQFDKDGNETLFGDIENSKSPLEEFSIISKEADEMYIVNLVDKTIIGPDVSYTLTGLKPELIYIRRNSVRLEIGTGKRLDPRVLHIIGLKTSKEEKQLEVFYGLGMKPKKIDFLDKKSEFRMELTDKITSEISKVAAIKEASAIKK